METCPGKTSGPSRQGFTAIEFGGHRQHWLCDGSGCANGVWSGHGRFYDLDIYLDASGWIDSYDGKGQWILGARLMRILRPGAELYPPPSSRILRHLFSPKLPSARNGLAIIVYFLSAIMNKRLQQIQNWPERAQAAKWCVATLAKDCGVSLRTLERYFLKAMGKHPKAWLAEQRQQRANELIQDGSSVKETAALLDYKHPSHLTNDFKNKWGCCPTGKTAPQRSQNH